MMSTMTAAIESARTCAGLSQRAMTDKTGISQATLTRILSAERQAKITEILLIADATGWTARQLTGSPVAERVECAARATNAVGTESMRQRLHHGRESDT